MSILIDKDTSMLIIGITGKQGRIHCKHILTQEASCLREWLLEEADRK